MYQLSAFYEELPCMGPMRADKIAIILNIPVRIDIVEIPFHPIFTDEQIALLYICNLLCLPAETHLFFSLVKNMRLNIRISARFLSSLYIFPDLLHYLFNIYLIIVNLECIQHEHPQLCNPFAGNLEDSSVPSLWQYFKGVLLIYPIISFAFVGVHRHGEQETAG